MHSWDVDLGDEPQLAEQRTVRTRTINRAWLRQAWPDDAYNQEMTLSARNKLCGQVEDIVLGDVMAHIVVRVGDNLIESVITRRSAEDMNLKKGDTVAAVVKATEVMILKD